MGQTVMDKAIKQPGLGNPYTTRAEEIRGIAEAVRDSECRHLLFHLAESYDHMARAQASAVTFNIQ
jgi:hypothetical protein